MTKNLDIQTKCGICNADVGFPSQAKKLIIEEYKQAVWRFMQEHSRYSKRDRSILTTFKSKDRANFEGRVWARYYGYQREGWKKPDYEEVKKETTKLYEKSMKNKGEKYLSALSKDKWLLRLVLKLYGIRL